MSIHRHLGLPTTLLGLPVIVEVTLPKNEKEFNALVGRVQAAERKRNAALIEKAAKDWPDNPQVQCVLRSLAEEIREAAP